MSLAGENRATRVVRAAATKTEIEGMTGLVLFPTPQEGSWPPFETFRESIATGPWNEEPHAHRLEEVVNYVLSGTLLHVDGEGHRVELPETTVAVLTAQTERRHDVSPPAGTKARWVSLIARLPSGGAELDSFLQVVDRSRAREIGHGIRQRNLVGSGSGTRSAIGLEMVDVAFSRKISWTFPLDPARRAVAYGLDGSGTVQGAPTPAGVGVLMEGAAKGIGIVADAGFRLLIFTAPFPSS